LIALSHRIHGAPELGCEEFKAAAWQTDLLRGHGFDVEMPYLGLDTAYRASVRVGAGAPRVAFLAEYDALAGAGHACGHNIIAACSVGAGIALAEAAREAGVACEVVVMGTPAEETRGCKVHLVEGGAFSGVDFALMMHPSTKNVIGRGSLAAQSLTVRYKGRAIHSAIPEKGVNALTSLIALFNAIDALRQVWPDTGRCNGIITEGGRASNIVPDLAEGKFTVRAGKRSELERMMAGIEAAVMRSAQLTGAEVETEKSALFAERYPNSVICGRFKANMESLGEKMYSPDPKERVGSSDIGNVSMVVPAIHDYLWIAPEEVQGHTEAFREAAASPRADEVVVLGAKGLAMTGWDLVTDGEVRAAARREFEALEF
jgi:amidohydrolase